MSVHILVHLSSFYLFRSTACPSNPIQLGIGSAPPLPNHLPSFSQTFSLQKKGAACNQAPDPSNMPANNLPRSGVIRLPRSCHNSPRTDGRQPDCDLRLSTRLESLANPITLVRSRPTCGVIHKKKKKIRALGHQSSHVLNLFGLWRWGGSFGPHKCIWRLQIPTDLARGIVDPCRPWALEATISNWSHKHKPACILQMPLPFGYIWATDFTELLAKDTLVAQT